MLSKKVFRFSAAFFSGLANSVRLVLVPPLELLDVAGGFNTTVATDIKRIGVNHLGQLRTRLRKVDCRLFCRGRLSRWT